MIGTATGNLVEENRITGNATGILVAAGARETTIRDNTVVGNPAVQVSNTRPDPQAVDIRNLAPPGQTTFERNICLTAVNAPCPLVTRPPQ